MLLIPLHEMWLFCLTTLVHSVEIEVLICKLYGSLLILLAAQLKFAKQEMVVFLVFDDNERFGCIS